MDEKEKDINKEVPDTETISETETVSETDVGTAEPEAGDAKASKKDKDGNSGKTKDKEKKNDKSEIKRLTAELAAAKKAADEAAAKSAEVNDKYLRIVAEYDNYRRRSIKEREGVYSDAYSDAVNELLPLIDNLDRAAAYTEPEKIAEGVAITLKTLPDVLTKMGIEEIETKKFDPALHNAVMHDEDDESEEGLITDVFQKGYRRGEKIIRHAMVKVVN